jgi:hypothetical protein
MTMVPLLPGQIVVLPTPITFPLFQTNITLPILMLIVMMLQILTGTPSLAMISPTRLHPPLRFMLVVLTLLLQVLFLPFFALLDLVDLAPLVVVSVVVVVLAAVVVVVDSVVVVVSLLVVPLSSILILPHLVPSRLILLRLISLVVVIETHRLGLLDLVVCLLLLVVLVLLLPLKLLLSRALMPIAEAVAFLVVEGHSVAVLVVIMALRIPLHIMVVVVALMVVDSVVVGLAVLAIISSRMITVCLFLEVQRGLSSALTHTPWILPLMIVLARSHLGLPLVLTTASSCVMHSR